MKLRKFRKVAPRKQNSEDFCSEDFKRLPRKMVCPVKKRILHEAHKDRTNEAAVRRLCADQGSEVVVDVSTVDATCDDDSPMPTNHSAMPADEQQRLPTGFYRPSDSSGTMTLEQFTDIVLASEGVLPVQTTSCATTTTTTTNLVAAGTCTQPVSSSNERLVEGEEKPHSGAAHNAMMKNIMQNKDLTVEVKPVRASKPVVLSPRHPEECYHSSRKATSSSASSSVPTAVSVTPRNDTLECLAGKPASVPLLVAEWFKKMEEPASPPARPPSTLSTSSTPDNSQDALNLSLRDAALKASDSNAVVTNKKIYLKPISSIQDPAANFPVRSPNHVQYSKSHHYHRIHHHHHLQKPYLLPARNVVLPPLSPPRLEITRVEAGLPTSQHDLKMKKVGISRPFETNEQAYRNSIKSRALRDIQLAHTKDMHGNYPIHMGVLMRKTDLVKRYCCVLQILDSTVDLVNEDRLTPLHLAVRDNSLEIVELLLAFGANPGIKDQGGNTSFHMAAATRAKECLQLLAESVRNKHHLNTSNEFGITPLQITMMNGDHHGTELLLKFGANPKLINHGQESPKFVKSDGKASKSHCVSLPRQR